jgi:hypothetical protein
MAKVNWINKSGGDFGIGTNWSTGTVPVSSSTANINAAGPGTYTVTSSGSPTVLAITTIPAATLDVTGGNFTALAGTGTGANAGNITVETGAIFTVGGTVKNSGIITLNGAGELQIYRDTILQGGGQITLSLGGGNSGHFNIFGSNTLTNVDNTISGFGNIETLALVNQTKGVIDANGSSGNALLIGNTALTNAGLLESTSTGGLVFVTGPITNTASGVIGAFGAGSTVTLENDSVSGGTLETAGGGEIVVGGVTFDGSNGHTVNNTGNVVVSSNVSLTLLGTINNSGTIALNGSSPYLSSIIVGAGGVTLAGSGSVTFSDNTTNEIIGSGTSTTLTNQNTISGAGEIGGNGLLLTNQGLIDATGANPLILDTGTSAITNSGTLEATSNGELFVASNVTNTGHLIANNGTEIFAGAVSGTGTATVEGGGSIEFGSTTTSNIMFASGAGTVTFDAASTLTGKLSITGFTLGDTIDLADINFVGSGPTLTFSKGILTVSDGTHVAKLQMIGNYTLASFHAALDGSGGTLITDPPATSSQSANVALNENTTNHSLLTTDPPTTSTTEHSNSSNTLADAFVFSPNLGQHNNIETVQDQIQPPHSEMLPHSELLAAISVDVHNIGQDTGVAHDASGLDHVLASHLHAAQNFHLV